MQQEEPKGNDSAHFQIYKVLHGKYKQGPNRVYEPCPKPTDGNQTSAFMTSSALEGLE
jgi:hypothetical protein